MQTRPAKALDIRGIAAATVSAASARIGDARSTYDDGIVSRVLAEELGGKSRFDNPVGHPGRV